MGNHNFVQKSNLFSFSATRCLRNEYFHNDCHICIDLCPKGAIHLVRNKLTLFDNECIECAGCIGSCPSEAYEIESFDPNEFAVSFQAQNNPQISCKSTTPCLGVFDADHLLVMALRGEMVPVCDISHCGSCPLNENGKMENTIREHIRLANEFLVQIAIDKKIDIFEEIEVEATRRALFRKGFEKAKEVIADTPSEPQKSMTASHHALPNVRMPLKRVLLKNSLKEFVGSLEITSFSENSPLFFNKQIDFQACTNCGDCTQFCPTDALFPTSDKQGIYFSQGKCIGCGICEDICKTKAITSKEGFDLVSIAYERAEQLVHYDMVMCHECRCPYPYKGGDPICDRCEGYKKEFSNMFTLAKDM
ncbi:MAG: 4Fe-4S binding protein [Sulfuricurvum sp.]|uniref:4Fe-4S binding protein n=1 Tax=Sulfuricurvum sp. TaxID=2025608 RepID=UPI0026056DB7|nr:4Fe-4S dicluster domain-containing protein [Sulfuricurvum sp.]MDD2828126.1 4Fe-4S binding protein [Sulfuricurvum sp.]MDD4948000.1 4Fe-4S binding protein [Sulfuricurvum sp.]